MLPKKVYRVVTTKPKGWTNPNKQYRSTTLDGPDKRQFTRIEEAINCVERLLNLNPGITAKVMETDCSWREAHVSLKGEMMQEVIV